eukprot:GHRQ01008858.1.p1 GENE.GHRQ01008858.1~~GHRQ01008858.1.p1  ORF type:complete len:195 (+),score=65.03 GHRQ01008858.1:1172-1756(+)
MQQLLCLVPTPRGCCRLPAQHTAARNATSSSTNKQDSSQSSIAAAAAAATAPGQQQEGPGFSLSGAAQDQLQVQQRLQDELTGELLDMTQELKASTLAMQSAIRWVVGCYMDGLKAVGLQLTASTKASWTTAQLRAQRPWMGACGQLARTGWWGKGMRQPHCRMAQRGYLSAHAGQDGLVGNRHASTSCKQSQG